MMIKKLFFWLVFLSVGMQAQNVAFADANFKDALLFTPGNNNYVLCYDQNGALISVDQNDDREIQLSEAALVYKISFRQSSYFTSLDGINSFVNLRNIAYRNDSQNSHQHPKIGNIAIDGLNNLQTFDLSPCDIAEVSIKNCDKLLQIQSSYTDTYNGGTFDMHGETQKLTVDNCPMVTKISWINNNLKNATITSCPNLTTLELRGNSLTSFDATPLTNLEYLDLSNLLQTWGTSSGEANLEPSLNDLNVEGLKSLNYLDVKNQKLTTLNLSSNTKLDIISVFNNPLESLLIKNGINETFHPDYGIEHSSGLPHSLKYICADESQIEEIKNYLSLDGYNAANITSYCSFTPGGDHNTISGTAKYDADNNGCDVSDNSFEFLKLKINDGTDSGQTFVQNDGNYQFYTQVGNFTVTAQAENPGLFTVAPSTFTTTFSDSNNNIYNQDICVTANGTQNDAEVVIAPLTGARPGFDATYKLVWRNKGNTVLTGKVIMNYDSNLMTFQGSTLPYSALSNGSIQFDYSGLKPFENASTEITFTVNTPTNATNPVNSGDVLAFNAQITPNNTDLTPEDNNFSFRQTVVNSFDPNDITCMEGEIIPSVAVGKYLHYVVNFENTGTAEAENIVVKMAIDPAEFDINTLQLQNASADVTTVITGNQVEFQFRNIKLQSGGHGNVLLKVKSLSALQEGDSVDNQAEIFFDYNFPIATNEYTTTILDANSVLTAKINYTAGNFSAGNYPVSFDGSFSTGGVVSYVWEFSGNPVVSSSTAASPVVTYSLAGYYTAKLTVFDINNNSHSQTISYKIGDVTADLSTGKDSNNNFIAIDSDDDDWKGFDINGTEIKPKVRHTFPGWSFADIGNSKNSQWITLNNTEGYYNYKSRQFTVPDNAADARLNLRSLSFVRNWTYLVQVNPDGTETETEITKTQFLSDGAKGWLNTRSPKVTDYALSPGTYYIKVLVYSNNGDVRESLDVNAVVSCSAGLINANKKAPVSPTLASETVLNNSISIYPIPTNGEVNIIASDVIKTVEVYDASGRITQTKRFTSAAKKEKINILGTKGIYYLTVKTAKGETTQKIIKE